MASNPSAPLRRHRETREASFRRARPSPTTLAYLEARSVIGQPQTARERALIDAWEARLVGLIETEQEQGAEEESLREDLAVADDLSQNARREVEKAEVCMKTVRALLRNRRFSKVMALVRLTDYLDRDR